MKLWIGDKSIFLHIKIFCKKEKTRLIASKDSFDSKQRLI